MRIYEGSPRQDFEEVFRSIGAFLDQRGMKDVLLLEAPDGFIVQGLVLSGASSGTWSESMGAQTKETLTFLDDRGRELRRFDRVPANPGVNHFLWNRRLPGADEVLAKDLEPLPRKDGPLVVPGRYAVRLTLGERSQTQSFEILPDPRVKASASDLLAQFTFLKAILAKQVIANATLNEIDALLAQVSALSSRVKERARSAALRKAADTLRAELLALRGTMIDVNYSQAQLCGSGLHEKLNALFDTVDSGDYAPAQQAREVFAVLSGQLDVVLAKWRDARERRVPALNRAAIKAKLQVIG